MPHTDCDDLKARADMLHQEAQLGRQQAKARGTGWNNYREQLGIADRIDSMALKVEATIAEDC